MRNARRDVGTRDAVVVALVAAGVDANRLPYQVVRVDAPRVTAQVARLVVLALRQLAVVQQNDGVVAHAVIVRVVPRRFVGVLERAPRSLGVGLDERDDAPGAVEL